MDGPWWIISLRGSHHLKKDKRAMCLPPGWCGNDRVVQKYINIQIFLKCILLHSTLWRTNIHKTYALINCNNHYITYVVLILFFNKFTKFMTLINKTISRIRVNMDKSTYLSLICSMISYFSLLTSKYIAQSLYVTFFL